MSFVERHKAWLLPLLGLGVVGVVLLNVNTFRKPAVSNPPPPSEAPSAPVAGAVTPAVIPPPPPEAVPNPPEGGDLWADLRSLEAPAPQLNDLPNLMTLAEQPLSEVAQPRPRLHPEAWGRLPALPDIPKATGEASAPPPLPMLDFILRTPKGRWAYFSGRPFTVGQSPDGHHRVLSIEARRVTLRGPDGRHCTLTTDLNLPLDTDSEAP